MRNPIHGETNAKRFAQGLPPLPPAWRVRGSKTNTAKRTSTSVTSSKSGKIKVTSSAGNTIGFLQLDVTQDRYIVGSASSPSTFTTFVYHTGVTTNVEFMDSAASTTHPYLAGLVILGTNLQSSNTNSAILGDSPDTSIGATPQSSGFPSIAGTQYESAIWSYDASSNGVTPSWVNYDSSKPTVSLVWDPDLSTVYITANPSGLISIHPNSVEVAFTFIA